MASRVLNITACCFVAVWPTALHGQGPDAQSVTQSLLDQHKSADPTNSARSLTGRSQEFDISKIPPPTGPSPKTTRSSRKTSRRIGELEEKKKKFLREKQPTEEKFLPASPGTSAAPRYDAAGTMRSADSPALTGRSPAAFNATKAQRKGNQDWEKAAERKWEETPDGKTLQRLKAEVAEPSKTRRKTEFDISDIPLPRSNPR